MWMIPFLSGEWWLSLSNLGWPVALVTLAIGLMIASLAAAHWVLQVHPNPLLLLVPRLLIAVRRRAESSASASPQERQGCSQQVSASRRLPQG